MTVDQYIHELNNTEIGNTNTNETYVSVPRSLVGKISFLNPSDTAAIHKRDGKAYSIKVPAYENGEYRITKLGPLYKAVKVSAGDLIQIEKCAGQLYVDFVQRKNLIVFACKKGSVFECLNEDRISTVLNMDIVCAYEGAMVKLKIVKGEKFKPRSDSDREVYAYGLTLDGVELSSKKDTLFNLFCFGKKAVMSEAERDVVCKIEWSDYE